MDSKPEMTVITKSVNDGPVAQVTVYKDRAQVTRVFDVALSEGIHELHITDFVDIEEDSIRVEGKGNATIAEVSFQSKNVHADEVTSDGREKELDKELNELLQKQKDLQISEKKELIEKERKLLDDFFKSASNAGVAPDGQETSRVVLGDPYLKGVRDYMKEYRTLSRTLICDLQELDKMDKKVTKQIDFVKKSLDDLRGNREPSANNSVRECIIVLDSSEETKIQLTLSYVVLSASWIPSYDLRMFTDEGTLKLFYYGLISQHSGEDWNDTKIFLSTAEPSFGGNIPRIPITHLSFYEPEPIITAAGLYPVDDNRPKYAKKFRQFTLRRSNTLATSGFSAMEYEKDIAISEIKVIDKTTSTSYEIARQSTIPSDNNPHKVTVAILDFQPELSYVTVPKASPNAFLQAKVINTSPYMLLAGASSIFLDNSFVSKAKLVSAAPKEEFTCSLGLDPSVRVNYKPIIKMKSSAGILTKVETTVYEQAIEVKNLHDKTVKVLVQDSLPKSTRDRIKVSLLSPEIDPKHPGPDVRLTKYNAIEWDLTIESMKNKEIILKYSIEHPTSERIQNSKAFVTPTN